MQITIFWDKQNLPENIENYVCKDREVKFYRLR